MIRRSHSQFINPIVPEIKKDNSIRLCLNARNLNEKVIDVHESTRSIDEILQICREVTDMKFLILPAATGKFR